MTDSPNPSPLFGRAGHLLDTTIERVIFDELDAQDIAQVQAHVDHCATCARRLDAGRRDELALASVLPERLPAPSSSEALPVPANTTWPWRTWTAGGAVALATVAAGLIWIGSGDPDPTDGTRLKGAPITLEAFATDDATTWRLADGDRVNPAWRVGFRVVSEQPGHLWIVGIDAALEPYAVFPANGDDPSWFEPHPEDPPALTAAVSFDTKPGMERVVALLCEVAFSYDVVVDTLEVAARATRDPERLPDLLPTCLQSEVRLSKSEGP